MLELIDKAMPAGKLGNARCGLVGRRLVDAALGTFGGVELNCVETAQTYASAIREHALGGILEEILALDALDYRLVVCTFKPQTADDTHFCQEELLSSEHPRIFFAVRATMYTPEVVEMLLRGC